MAKLTTEQNNSRQARRSRIVRQQPRYASVVWLRSLWGK